MPFANRDSVTLLANGSATGANLPWNGGAGMFTAEAGSWNTTAVATLQVLTPNGTFCNVGASCNFGANGVGGFVLPASIIRVMVSGNVPANLSSYAVGMN